MNDFLLTLGLIAAAICLAMAITAWRIRRIQYPPELRWPKDRGQRSRSKSKSKPDSKSPPAD